MSASKSFKIVFILLAILAVICVAKADKDGKKPKNDGNGASPLNIPERLIGKSFAYKQLSETIESRLNLSADPCNDFYGYVCDNYQGTRSILDASQKDEKLLLDFILNITDSDSRPAKLEKLYFLKIREALLNASETSAGAKLPRSFVTKIEKATGVKFPLANGNPKTKMSTKQLGQAIGHLCHISTGIRVFIDVELSRNYHDSDLIHALRFTFLGPSNKAFFFNNSDSNSTRQAYIDNAVSNLSAYLLAIGAKIDNATIKAEAEKLADIEYLLSQHKFDGIELALSEQTTTDKLSARMSGVIDIAALLKELTSGLGNKIRDFVLDPNYKIYTGSNFYNFLTAFNSLKKHGISSTNVWNYVFYRIIETKKLFLPGKKIDVELPQNSTNFLATPENTQANVTEEQRYENAVTSHCLDMLPVRFEEIHSQLYLRAIFPDEKDLQLEREDMSRMTERVVLSYKSMFEQTSWMSEKSRENANLKLDQMIRNIFYSEHTFNDTYLESYYEDLNIDENMDFLDIEIEVEKFNIRKSLSGLTATGNASSTVKAFMVNAYYAPEENSINILASLPRLPLYHRDFPSAFKFGGFGIVLSHEIGHAFDSFGSHFNGKGKLDSILDDETYAEYNKTVQCVIDEYNKICVSETQCVDGTLTQSENLADNAAIRAAHQAYQISIKGVEPRLPGKITRQFTDDQIFFIGVGSLWCTNKQSWATPNFWHDTHAPSFLRPLGALQNSESFRAAFNCPAGSKYAPEKTCKVWTTDVEPNLPK